LSAVILTPLIIPLETGIVLLPAYVLFDVFVPTVIEPEHVNDGMLKLQELSVAFVT
jgi:hypothetical protein